jgi:diguanylate cyclase (GGDEF)-like protein/PAS domain S-box-containing protein
MNYPKILVIKDQKILAVDIRNSLQKLGYLVSEITDSAEETIKKVAETRPHLVLIDISLTGEIDGIQAATIIRNNFQIPVLYVTDFLENENLQKRHLSEPFTYILKSFAERDLHIAVEMALYNYQEEKRLQEENQRMEAIFNNMGCAVVVTDLNGCIERMNPIAETLTGWLQQEACGKDFVEILKLVDKDTGENIQNLAVQVIQTATALKLPDNCILITKDGTKMPIGDNITPIRDGDGSVTGAVVVFQDITERKRIEEQLLRNTFYDALTALPNRVLFQDRLTRAIERSKRKIDYRFGVLFLDLDGFKGINDRFGHGIGDMFLVEIAKRLESCLRSGDTIARFGGDEFAVLLEDVKEVSDATNVAKRIQNAIALPLSLNGHEIFTTASIGIALSGSGNKDDEPDTLLRDADIAMYQAKQEGKARFRVQS